MLSSVEAPPWIFPRGRSRKESPNCLCGQAEADYGGSEGDLVKGTDVGDVCVFSSTRVDRPFDEEAPSGAQSKGRRETTMGSRSEQFNKRIDNLVLTRG